MLNIVIAVFIVIIVMISLIFWVLKRMINTLNEQTKGLFVNKLQTYDDLISQKELELEKLKKKIEELSSNFNENNDIIDSNDNKVAYYEMKNMSYKDKHLLDNYRKISEKFKIDPYQIVKNFIEKYWNDNSKETYLLLNEIRNKFNDENKYSFLIINQDEQVKKIGDIFNQEEQKIFQEYLEIYNEFDLLNFLIYIDDLIIKNDPNIYVKAGNKDLNFNNLNAFIKVEYDEKIYIGVQIIYKSKLYDYSIS
jgi:hypothetical protein